MILITGYYFDAHAGRRDEFLHCIRRNCSNPFIDELHVFVEDSSDPATLVAMLGSPGKLRLVTAGRRTPYRELFDYANKNFVGQDVVIANGDVFFDRSLQRLHGYNLLGRL